MPKTNSRELPFLRARIKNLAHRAMCIRREERKALKSGRYWRRLEAGDRLNIETPGQIFGYLNYHALHQMRVVDTRREARACLLAYGFLHGRPYDEIEHSVHNAPDWGLVADLVELYDLRDKIKRARREQLVTWLGASALRSDLLPWWA